MNIAGILLYPESLEDNPSLDSLRERALEKGAQKTKFESLALYPKVKGRLTDKTEINWGEPTDEQRSEIEKAFKMMRGKHMMALDRLMGQGEAWSCRLVISSAYPETALIWASLLRESPLSSPNFLTISIPEFPRPHVYVFPNHFPPLEVLLGVDYGGEHKMAFLKQFLYRSKRDGLNPGLGLHAASTSFFVLNEDGELEQKNAIFLAESGTGKSSLSSHSYGLKHPERIAFRQDDIVSWKHDGRVLGTEQKAFYYMVAKLKRSAQSNIWVATRSQNAIFENVTLNSEGVPDFDDLSISQNPRVSIPLEDIENATTDIDMDTLHFVFLITRQFDIVPPVMRLSPERAAYEFMCGRTVSTAATASPKNDEVKRTVGFNPFIMGDGTEAQVLSEEGNLFLGLVRANPEVQVFLINTGAVGGTKDGGPGDIKVKDTTAIIREIVRGRVHWQQSTIFGDKHSGQGYEEPKTIRGVKMSRFDPLQYYSESQVQKFRRKMLRSDREWMEQFRGELDPQIMALLD